MLSSASITARETEDGDDKDELGPASGELSSDMASDEGEIPFSLLGRGDLYGLAGFVVGGPCCRLPYVNDLFVLSIDLGGAGAARIGMIAIDEARKGK